MDARHKLDVGETANEAEVGLEVQWGHVFINLPATLRTWGGLRIMASSPGSYLCLTKPEFQSYESPQRQMIFHTVASHSALPLSIGTA